MKSTFAAVLLFCGAGMVQAAAPIEGAFGLKFGEVFEPTSTPDYVLGDNSGYAFTPPQPNPAFSRYYVWITPTTHVVWKIGAVGVRPDQESKERAELQIKALISQKYGDGTPLEGLIMRGGQSILVASGSPTVGKNEFYIKYDDSGLRTLAKQEKEELQRQEQVRRQEAMLKEADATGL